MRGSGKFNVKLDLQKVSTSATTDIAGQIDLTQDSNWSTFAKRSACIKPAKGSEFWNVDQVDANGMYEISFQYDSLTRTLGPRNRLKTGTRKFNIESVLNVDERNRVITVAAMDPK